MVRLLAIPINFSVFLKRPDLPWGPNGLVIKG